MVAAESPAPEPSKIPGFSWKKQTFEDGKKTETVEVAAYEGAGSSVSLTQILGVAFPELGNLPDIEVGIDNLLLIYYTSDEEAKEEGDEADKDKKEKHASKYLCRIDLSTNSIDLSHLSLFSDLPSPVGVKSLEILVASETFEPFQGSTMAQLNAFLKTVDEQIPPLPNETIFKGFYFKAEVSLGEKSKDLWLQVTDRHDPDPDQSKDEERKSSSDEQENLGPLHLNRLNLTWDK